MSSLELTNSPNWAFIPDGTTPQQRHEKKHKHTKPEKRLKCMCVGQPPAPPQPQVTCAHTHNQLYHKRLRAASHPPTHSTEPDPPPLSLTLPPYLFFSVSCSPLPTLIHKMAASQLQLLAWNLRMRGQGQQRAKGEILVYSIFPPPSVPLCAHSHQRVQDMLP